ncbi:MAG: phage holin family protein [Paludibacteraceae bacterium]|jgi:hypothetical protein|nr:phage holin family protein [Paludibacteraceae bacterium]
MIKESYQQLWQDSKKYLELRYDLLRVELLEKVSLISALLLTAVVAILLGTIIFTYLSILLLLWLETLLGSMIYGLCIVIGIHVILFACLFIFRKQCIINPLVRQFSKIIFNQNKQEEEVQP